MISLLITSLQCLALVGIQWLVVWILAKIFSRLNDKILPDDED